MRKIFIISLIIALGFLIFISTLFLINNYVLKTTEDYIFADINNLKQQLTDSNQSIDAVLVLGARVKPLSDVLKDRLDTAYEIYKLGLTDRFLLSGDHGQEDYDEVNEMKDYLLAKGVNENHIFLDHAGFDTYDSLTRAKEVFEVNSLIISTQDFHLARAVYIARKKDINAFGIVADKQDYLYINAYKRREFLARIKSFFDVLINAYPAYLGDKIPISGDASLSWD